MHKSPGFVFCVISLLCALFLGLFDRRAEKIIKREGELESDENTNFREKIKIKDIVKFPLKLWLLITVCVMYYAAVDPFLGLSVYDFIHA